jgi:hypothetical protein
MFGNHYARPCVTSSSSLMPVVNYIPKRKETGRIEEGLFSSKGELEERIDNDFFKKMADETKKERELREAQFKKQEEERKQQFLKEKWLTITRGLVYNYHNIDLENFDNTDLFMNCVNEEIKRCMLIPSQFLRTKLVEDCDQCSKNIWKTHERHKQVRDPHDESLDFDGHFPEDHINLEGLASKKTKEEKEKESDDEFAFYGSLKW